MNQVQKNALAMGGLLVVTAGVGLYAYFGVMKGDEREAERKEVDAKLFSAYEPGQKATDGGALPNPEFVSITVKAKGDTTVLEKRDGKWWVTSPVSAAADPMAVDQVTSALQNQRFKETIEDNPTEADLEKYGLKDPKLMVRAIAEAQGQRREVTLYGGIENTFDGSLYARKDGEKAVRSVEGGIRYSLEKSTFDLRNKEVLALDEPKLTKVEVKGKNAYVLERDGEKHWRITRPIQEAADDATVQAMLNAFKGQRATAFPKDDEATRKQDGLDAPKLDATFTFDSGATVRIRVSKTDKTWALREEGKDSVLAEVPDAALTELDKPAQDLRDRTVLSFKRDDVAKVSFQKAGGPQIVAEKVVTDGGPEEWRITAPETGPAKKWKLSSLMWSLGALKSTAFGEEKPKSWSKYGMDKPARMVTLFDGSGKQLAKLVVGSDVKDKPNTAYARGSRDQVVEIDTSRLNDFPNVASDVLDKPLGDGGSETAFKN